MAQFCRVLFIFALYVHQSEGNNDKDNSCFNFDSRGLVSSRLEGPAGSGSEYAVVNLTHTKHLWFYETGSQEEIVVKNSSFLLESGQKKVIELNAEGEVEWNPRELTIAFNGTHVNAAIGIHTMFNLPSQDAITDEWRCWNWSEPLQLGEYMYERTETEFCKNWTEAENGTVFALVDKVELVVQKHWRPPHFSGNEDNDCFTSQFPGGGNAQESARGTPAPPSKVNVEVRDGINISKVELTEGDVTVVQMWYNSLDNSYPPVFQDQNPRNLSLLLTGEKVVWAGLALLEEKEVYNGYELGWSYSTWWTCERGNAARLPVPSGQTSSVANLTKYTFHYREDDEFTDTFVVAVMGSAASAASLFNSNSFYLILIFLCCIFHSLK